MKTCKTCKFWNKPDNEYGEVPGAGTCKAVPQYWDVTEWSKDFETRQLKPQYANTLAFACDGSDYHASFETMANFGCVMHQSI